MKVDKLIVLIVILIIGFNYYTYGQENTMVVNGKRVEILVSGRAHNQTDKPVIVFENGRGSTFNSWEKVIKEISKENTIFAYNRPRIGKSVDDSIPPSMKHIVENLRIMLKEKGLKPPYLLVGHSFGACYIRTFASYYPEEIAGLIFVDPHDFTKKEGDSPSPYEEIGLSKHQIDSIFVVYDSLTEQYMKYAPKAHIEEIKIQGVLSKTGNEECNRNPLPNVPVHFIMAGGFKLNPEEMPTIYDREKLFRIDSNIKMKRWLELLYPLKYGMFFYDSNSGHAIQIDNPDLVITSIELALKDYDKIERSGSRK